MKKVRVFACLAAWAALGLAADDPKPKPQPPAEAPANSEATPANSQPAALPAPVVSSNESAPAPTAANPDPQQTENAPEPPKGTIPLKGATNPSKMAEPSKSAEAKVASASPYAKTFIIGAEDVLHIQVFGNPEFSTTPYRVRPDGIVTVPLIGDVMAAGLTTEELTRQLTDSMKQFIVDPQVTIRVLEVNSRAYYIQGEVYKPGKNPLVVPTRVLEALVNAGGFREFANTKKIVVLRGSERKFFNYKQVSKGEHLEQNILLEPGDIIIVQ